MLRRSVFLAAAIACLFPVAARGKDCTRTSVGFTPLTDLGSGLYHGAEGGLYPGGSNVRPAAHNAAGLAIANAITPLDTLGNPSPSGRIVLISIGMSNTTQEFSAFVPKANADPSRNPRVQAIDCAQGGQAAGDINRPNAPYWDTVYSRLRSAGSSPAQAQVVWLKEAERAPTDTFPVATLTLMRDLGAIVRIIKDKLPNVRICYLTSRIYAGYALTNLNPEPYAYESGFAVKWLVAGQIAGEDSLEYDPGAGPVEAPWLSWGPYLWADGLTPRSDGLTWTCDAYVEDGTHPSTIGRGVVADSLLAFFHRDETATPWYLLHATNVSAAAGNARTLVVGPSPARGSVRISFGTAAGERWQLDLLDVAGRRIAPLGRGIGRGGTEQRIWDLCTMRGDRVPGGLYWVRLTRGGGSSAQRVMVLGPSSVSRGQR